MGARLARTRRARRGTRWLERREDHALECPSDTVRVLVRDLERL
jgi:hypothetical protein